MPQETILVVDDCKEILSLLGNKLIPTLGFNVITASDGKIGLEKAIRFQTDDQY